MISMEEDMEQALANIQSRMTQSVSPPPYFNSILFIFFRAAASLVIRSAVFVALLMPRLFPI